MAALRRHRRSEESPGSMETRCRLTAGGGDPRESATETYRLSKPSGGEARVKWCGKSAPRFRQRRRQGKPHREQDQVGMAGLPQGEAGCVSASPSGSVARGAWQQASQRNGHPPPQGGDRTRLTGHLAIFLRQVFHRHDQTRRTENRWRVSLPPDGPPPPSPQSVSISGPPSAASARSSSKSCTRSAPPPSSPAS